ncbi:hypothetical protein [Paenibacillus sp. OV219]|uniref:hypothetical protein n=1 Tax=Paenibacillus sp. OV219 TaxID=1884377 RepID=UPI0008AD87F8|nr:hypothetical protein [Paenibacillus sp. OV219]SEN95245.1 hypothetical protein SAMN05518847_10545 [Paenibacillus sp. OV219]
MDPLLQEHKKHALAGFLSVLLTAVVSLIGIVNWLSLRGLVIAFLGYFEVDPFKWQAIDYSLFIILGIGWLVFVYYSQYHFKKRVLSGGLWKSFTKVLSIQAWILFACGLPYLLAGMQSKLQSDWILIVVEGIGALVLSILSAALGKKAIASDQN